MPNRTGRARHLTLVPDLPTEPRRELEFARAVRDVPADGASGIVQLTLHVELLSYVPTVWRRLRLRSDLLLPELHALIQAAMGWHDEHYRLDSASDTFVPAGLRDGTDAAGDHVRVDAVLARPGDRAYYRFDEARGLSVQVMAVDMDIDDLRPTCLGAENICPGHGADADAVSGRSSTPTVDEINTRLRGAREVRSSETESAAASALVARLFSRSGAVPKPRLLELLPRCELTIESSVDLPVADTAMTKMMWLLRKVGDSGIALAGGRLPPRVVEAVRDELDWGIGWVGDSLFEADHHQATDLREAAKALGLVRVFKGELVRTRVGTALVDDPVGLWHHCAARLPLGKQPHEQDAGTLFLIALAASASRAQRDAMIVEVTGALDWVTGDHGAFEAQKIAHPTVAFLDLIGAHGPLFYLGGGGAESPIWARRFARDALRTSRRL
ncbi:hypothetical protein [Rhodococcus sp. 14-2470-1a]|uniref:IS1096 element passenger TnpR family protein n=1 Tax=Rhodococcus sp. 14-2470-1a TaxID=2023150 RepID=UPI000B9B30F5|nr:hypothetical protein [Rhodococcus sp. 14-2470-1a]OZF53581.1 hypothetical protein CH292_09490 [Rhodococcus sp. 14-2470-1a]